MQSNVLLSQHGAQFFDFACFSGVGEERLQRRRIFFNLWSEAALSFLVDDRQLFLASLSIGPKSLLLIVFLLLHLDFLFDPPDPYVLNRNKRDVTVNVCVLLDMHFALFFSISCGFVK